MNPWGETGNGYGVSFAEAEQIYDAVMSEVCCPCCGRKGDCVKWGFYERWTRQRLSEEGKLPEKTSEITEKRERVQRVRCRHCHHTHALLAMGVVPYRQCTLAFILCALEEYMRTGAACSVSAKYGIPASTLYRWLEILRGDLAQTDNVYIEPKKWLCSWTDHVDAAFLQSFLLANGRLLLENPRPLRATKKVSGTLPCSSEFLKWPAA